MYVWVKIIIMKQMLQYRLQGLISSVAVTLLFFCFLEEFEHSKSATTMIIICKYSVCTYTHSDIVTSQGTIPGGCTCPGDTLTYTCTVRGGLADFTVWTGTGLDCEIVLLHIRFANGVSATCNNGAIVARSLSVVGNNYTSQLNVTLNSETTRKTIECLYDNGMTNTLVLSLMLPTSGLSP